MELTLEPTWKQHLVYEALKDPLVDEVFFGGGAGGGKSWLICESRLVNAHLYPGYRSFIAREELKRLMESTYITWLKVCQHHKVPKESWKLNGQYNYIEFTNGSRIDLLDVKFMPSDPLYERFGSTEYTDGAIEEAGEIHALAREVLKSRINRHLNKEFGIKATLLDTGNPKKNWTYNVFYKPWKEKTLPDNMRFIQALYNDNPYTAEDYGRTLSLITDKSMRERLRDGNWEYEDDPNALIKYEAMVDLFTNTVDESREKYLIVDAARYGGDKIVFNYWEGLKCYKQVVKQLQGIDVTSEDIKIGARDERVPYSHILIDEDGVGGGIVDTLRGIKGFVANSTPFPPDPKQEKPDNYVNLKSQCSFKLADLINNHKIAFECNDVVYKSGLIEDLEQVKEKDRDKEGKKKIVSKDEIKESIGRSPDYGDTLMMRMYFEFTPNAGEMASVFVPHHQPIITPYNTPQPDKPKVFYPRR
jgi:phage terminase large subunit